MTRPILKFLIAWLFCGAFSHDAWAEEVSRVQLSSPDQAIEKLCQGRPWSGLRFVWKGVEDHRLEPQIGTQVKKEVVTNTLLSEVPLAQLLNPVFHKLFTTCGMELLEQPREANALSLTIKEFHAGVQKKLVTGTSEAKSRILVDVTGPVRALSVELGCELDSRKVRSRNIKQLTATLNDLLACTVEQVASSNELKSLR